ncbi:MAG: hypothetical protein J6V08_04200 [Candidatus Methanomethylophilaceae archaeon]|nr:hypothetical protein [Candidatus Methanomethylophilaceae archaeon]
MKMDRRGVTALPIKLLIITILVTISIPMISDVMESTEDTMNTRIMEDESDKISNAVRSVYYSMNGARKVVEIDVPDGCRMILGGDGDDAYAIHMYCGGELMSQRWMEKPILSFDDAVELAGNCTISITTTDRAIEVAAL